MVGEEESLHNAIMSNIFINFTSIFICIGAKMKSRVLVYVAVLITEEVTKK